MAELSTVARPYADAVFKRAVETDTIAQWSDDLRTLSLMTTNEMLAEMLDNPTVSQEQQVDVLLSIVEDTLQAEVKNLIQILAENGRLVVLSEISKAYDALKVDFEGKIDVQVVSAFAVTQGQLSVLTAALKKRLGKEVNVTTSEDASLLGGLIIKAGDLVIDGSIKAKLSKMATDLGI